MNKPITERALSSSVDAAKRAKAMFEEKEGFDHMNALDLASMLLNGAAKIIDASDLEEPAKGVLLKRVSNICESVNRKYEAEVDKAESANIG